MRSTARLVPAFGGSDLPLKNLGCFQDNYTTDTSRALARRMSSSYNMTVAPCHSTAIDKNVTLFALQFGKE